MTGRLSVAVALLSLGCGVSPAMKPKVPAPAPQATSDWAEFEVTGGGIFARFPSVPTESASYTQGDPSFPYRGLEAKLDDHTVAVVELVIGPRGSDEAVLSVANNLVKYPSQRSRVALGGFRGVEIVGESDKHKAKAVRAYALGGSVVFLSVEKGSGKLDDGVVHRFFDSVRFDVPWRVRPLPEIGVSIALPAQAFQVDAKDENARAFVLGGEDDIGYYVSSTPVAPEFQDTPDETLNRVLEGYAKTGTLAWSAPVEDGGTRGREVLIDMPKEHLRVRVYITHDRLYQSIMTAAAKERLTGDDAKRFLGSLRWFE